jgi:hypothetical protein
MPNRLDRKIVLAAATMLIGGVPAWSHGAGSVGHSSISASRVGASARSVGPTSTRVSSGARWIGIPGARMLVTTAPSPPTKTIDPTTTTSAVADPPAPGAAIVTTSPSTISGVGTLGSGGLSPSNLGQFNTGAQDLATPAVSAPRTTVITTTTPATIGSQILGVRGLILPNAATSGAVLQAPTSGAVPGPLTAVVESQGEVIAASGGTAITGAIGKNMPECMAAWDKATHITKPRWHEICARTLIEPHV